MDQIVNLAMFTMDGTVTQSYMSGRPNIMQYVCAFIVMELFRITRQLPNSTNSLCTAVNVSASGDFVL